MFLVLFSCRCFGDPYWFCSKGLYLPLRLKFNLSIPHAQVPTQASLLQYHHPMVALSGSPFLMLASFRRHCRPPRYPQILSINSPDVRCLAPSTGHTIIDQSVNLFPMVWFWHLACISALCCSVRRYEWSYVRF